MQRSKQNKVKTEFIYLASPCTYNSHRHVIICAIFRPHTYSLTKGTHSHAKACNVRLITDESMIVHVYTACGCTHALSLAIQWTLISSHVMLIDLYYFFSSVVSWSSYVFTVFHQPGVSNLAYIIAIIYMGKFFSSMWVVMWWPA